MNLLKYFALLLLISQFAFAEHEDPHNKNPDEKKDVKAGREEPEYRVKLKTGAVFEGELKAEAETTEDAFVVLIVAWRPPHREFQDPEREASRENEAELVPHQQVFAMADVEQRQRKERIGPIGPPAQSLRQLHPAQGHEREQNDLQHHPGAEILREAPQPEVNRPRLR